MLVNWLSELNFSFSKPNKFWSLKLSALNIDKLLLHAKFSRRSPGFKTPSDSYRDQSRLLTTICSSDRFPPAGKRASFRYLIRIGAYPIAAVRRENERAFGAHQHFVHESRLSGKMSVPVRLIASTDMLPTIFNGKAPRASVQCGMAGPALSAISYAMPDIHWGYGFPIAG